MPPFHDLDPVWTRALFDEAPTPMALVAHDHRLVRCNDAFCELVGYARGELITRTWQSITHPDDVKGDEDGAKSLRLDATVEAYSLNKRYISKSGRIVWVNLHVRGVWDGRKFLAFYVVALPLSPDAAQQPQQQSAPPPSLLQWAKSNPKDAIIVAGAAGLFLGRDGLASLIQFLLKH